MNHNPRKKVFAAVLLALCCLTGKPVYADSAQKTILAFGDSLTSGYGIPLDQAFPAQLEKKLQAEGYAVKVINAGVSGDTTSGGLTRLEWVLSQEPDFVILALGANDMLRGTDPKVTRANLRKILEIIKGKKIPVLLAGTRSAPNLGFLFSDRTQKMYEELAEEYGAVYYPFFLDGVILDPKLMQQDGMHPNVAGIAKIVENIFPDVEGLLER